MTELEKLKRFLLQQRFKGTKRIGGFMWGKSAETMTLEELAKVARESLEAMLDPANFEVVPDDELDVNLLINARLALDSDWADAVRKAWRINPDRAIKKFFQFRHPEKPLKARDVEHARQFLFGTTQIEKDMQAESLKWEPTPFFRSQAMIDLQEFIDKTLASNK